MKPRHKRLVFLIVLSVLALAVLAMAVIPPMVSLDRLKPHFEHVILSQTGIPAKIDGKIHMSFLGHATVVASDVSIPNGKIDSILFSVPISSIFDISQAPLTGRILVDGAQLDIQEIIAPKIARTIELRNSAISFRGKSYRILEGQLKNGNLRGTVRMEQRKYAVETSGRSFSATNKNEGLKIDGILRAGGGATGSLAIDTDDINTWFNFFEPRIQERVSLTMNFDWDGGHGFRFSDLSGNVGGYNFSGSIELPDSSAQDMMKTPKTFQFASNDIDIDLTFLLDKKPLLSGAALDLDLRGNIKFMNTVYQRMRLKAANESDAIIIDRIEFENDKIRGSVVGEISAQGAQSLTLRLTRDPSPLGVAAGAAEISCLFSGDTEIWRCSEYSYSDKNIAVTGTLVVDKNGFHATLKSKSMMPENFDYAKTLAFLGNNGTVAFDFANAVGKITIKNKKQTIEYASVKDKSLDWLGTGFEFLPAPMRAARGDMTWDAETFSFIPSDEIWELHAQGNFFFMSGNSAKEFLTAFYPNIELPFTNDFPYQMSGNYSKPYIKDLEIRAKDHIFRGSVSGTSITLKTETLDLNAFADQRYFDNYEEMKFLSGAPILAPFLLGDIGLSLSASAIIWDGNAYDNFVYSLRGGAQDFSITDDAKGSLIVSIKKNSAAVYDILVQLNKFSFAGPLLAPESPLNISDSVITGRAILSTSGKIAYDFWNNIKGTLDISFDGGILNGIGTDWFYSRAADLTRLNAEDAIARALSGGDTKIKSFRISGVYESGKFQTSKNFLLSARNAEMSGDLLLQDGKLSVRIGILLRGASADPRPIFLNVLPDGARDYSMSEIMTALDPDYLANFVLMSK